MFGYPYIPHLTLASAEFVFEHANYLLYTQLATLYILA